MPEDHKIRVVGHVRSAPTIAGIADLESCQNLADFLALQHSRVADPTRPTVKPTRALNSRLKPAPKPDRTPDSI